MSSAFPWYCLARPSDREERRKIRKRGKKRSPLANFLSLCVQCSLFKLPEQPVGKMVLLVEQSSTCLSNNFPVVQTLDSKHWPGEHNNQGYPTSIFGKYLFGRRFEIELCSTSRVDRVSNARIYDLTQTAPLVENVRTRQLRFLGHVLRMPDDEPCKEYALYIPPHGKRKPGRQRTLFLRYIQNLLGDTDNMIGPGKLSKLAQDCCGWRKLVVACSAADRLWCDDDDSKWTLKTKTVEVVIEKIWNRKINDNKEKK